MKVLFVVSEINPLIKSGGLADVASALPKELAKLGLDVRIALPDYSVLDRKELKYAHKPSVLKITTPSEKIDCLVSQVSHPEIPNPIYLFKTGRGLKLPVLYPGPDDAEQDRFLIFSLGVIEWLKTSDWQPDIVSCHDWMSGAIPQLIKQNRLPYRSLLTIHNAAYQGIIPTVYMDDLGIKINTVAPQANLLRLGISSADKINTVSPTYSREVLTAEYGFGLEMSLAQRQADFVGILNGVDYQMYNPETDPYVPFNYSGSDVEAGKASNKQTLQQKLGLEQRPDSPLFGLVARLDDQKGLNLVETAVKSTPLLKHSQLVILGVGDAYWERRLKLLSAQYPSVKVVIKFDESLARHIFAASDFILVPSKFEPCGLTQLIALKYGAIPVVRHTGGLADTIIDQHQHPRTGTGIVFQSFTAKDFSQALGGAIGVYENPRLIKQIRARAMAQNFSWEESAQKYQKLFQQLLRV